MAGLTLANQLQASAEVIVFEKSRGYGGRMATRLADNYQFDHGAQFFIAKTPAFQEFVQTLIKDEVIALWKARFVELQKSEITYQWTWTDEVPHYVAVPGMNALGKYMARDLSVKLDTHVGHITRQQDSWLLADQHKQKLGVFDWVISAIPAKQGLDLLPNDFAFIDQLTKKKMLGCYSLMLGYQQALPIDWDAALVKLTDISWICNNGDKPGRPDQYALLAHATNNWAEANMEMDDSEVTEHLIDQLETITQLSLRHADHISLHRWRYANVKKQDGDLSYVDHENKLAAIGDWCIKGRIESAFQSAQDAANKIRMTL